MMGDRLSPEEIEELRKRKQVMDEWAYGSGVLLGVVDGDRPAFTDDEDERR